ncbi:zinc finger domain-containing protein [Streptomyces albipurpureus]|uniref:zinc finger domain-containing protein n=1 Tax=Streptomyces albipurpureus TaxID=2897419 RepID=UPI003CE55601
MPRHVPTRLSVRCPWCHAPTGEPCTVPSNGRRLPTPHDARLTAVSTDVEAPPAHQDPP